MAYRSAQYDDEHYELVLIDKSVNKRLYLAGIQLFLIIILGTLLMGYLDGMFTREEQILQCRADPKSPACPEIFARLHPVRKPSNTNQK